MIEKLMEAYKLFEDDFSKKIFDMKAKWYFQGGEDETNDYLYKAYSKSHILDLEKYAKEYRYAICGAGNLGKKTLKALQHAGYEVACFLDNDKHKKGTVVDGVKICSFTEFVCDKTLSENTVVIIDNVRFSDMFFAELFELGFPQERIYKTKDDIVRTAFGNIYFDLDELKWSDDEVFIDAGSFNGESSIAFINTMSGKYEKIYACEPMSDGYEMCVDTLSKFNNIELHKVALSNRIGEATFAQTFGGLMGSRLGENGDSLETVMVDTIDNILQGQKATFIKMDIEGAELEALKGARNTLLNYKPKLAISLYHKNEDLYEIPLWLNSVVPEYKFYLRHYSNKRWDLVLYCVVD